MYLSNNELIIKIAPLGIKRSVYFYTSTLLSDSQLFTKQGLIK